MHLADFAIFGDTTVRNDQISDSGLGGALGGGSTVDNLWIEHTKVGAWFDGPVDGLTITNLRIQDTMADGINLHNGVSHVTVSNTFVRNTGDDGMAMWSDQNADHDNSFTHDTVSVPVLANGFAIYGGHDNTISDNIASDTVTQGGGVQVGNRFGSVPLAGHHDDQGQPARTRRKPGARTTRPRSRRDLVLGGRRGDERHDQRQQRDDPRQLVRGACSSTARASRTSTSTTSTSSAPVRSPCSSRRPARRRSRTSWRSASVQPASTTATAASPSTGVPATSAGPTTKCGFPPAGQLQIAQATGIDFGFQSLNTSATLPIAITNPGPKPVTITVGHAAGRLHGRRTPARTIAVGATCTLTVAFTPTTSGNYSGLLTIDSTSPAGPYVVALSGVGFDPNGDLALGRAITSSSEAADYFGPYKLVDGDQGSYFESLDGDAFPQTVTLDLGQSFSVDRIVLTLPPGWGTRTETLSIVGGR